MELPEIDDYQALLCADVPLLDVRAPIEFAQGAFPCSHLAPLLNDEEREQIGIRYKKEGHDAAVELGAKLIQGEVKAARVAKWREFVERYPQGVLYCFRGGMRSKITQQWIQEEVGVTLPRVKGGYKALRRYLIDSGDALAAKTQPLILSGRTGSGKTRLIKKLKHAIDLEGLANHRGSSIGRQLSPQPSQIDFENKVSIELIKFHQQGIHKIVLEDESPNIGSLHIPHSLYDQMRVASCVILEASQETRLEITLQEYVTDMLVQYVKQEGDERKGFVALGDYLRNSLTRVQRRLGGQRYQEILALMNAALAQQAESGETTGHLKWLSRMLLEYYDPMYDYQRDKRQRKVEKAADFNEMLAFLHDFH